MLARLSTEDGRVNRRFKAASRSHEDATIESLGKHPALAVEYLNAVLADGDQKELMLALRRLSRAFGGIARLARNADSTQPRSTARSLTRATRSSEA